MNRGQITIVVLGMHRSATSLVAKGMCLNGVFMGYDLIGPAKSNPWGHFEDREIVHLNDEILYAAGGRWDNPPPEDAILSKGKQFVQRIKNLIKQRDSAVKPKYPLWGWKDPRTTLTIKLFLPHLTNPHFVCCFTDPMVVAKSLFDRDGTDIQVGHGLALEYNARLLAFISEFYGFA